jgi:hypothetical protein
VCNTVKLGREFSREDVSRSKDHHVSSSAVRARNAAGIQKVIMGYTASLSQQEQFVNSLVKAIVPGSTPFSFVDNESWRMIQIESQMLHHSPFEGSCALASPRRETSRELFYLRTKIPIAPCSLGALVDHMHRNRVVMSQSKLHHRDCFAS